VRNIFQKEKAALTFRSCLFVLFRHKNIFSATLFIPCTPIGGKVKKYVDSAKGENDFAVYKNVFNDYYAKDTSKKIRTVVKMRGETGEHLTSNPPYRYVNKN
jgi:hypothetical protein